MNEEQLRLKIDAYREELSLKTEQVADLRVNFTILNKEVESLRERNDSLSRKVIELEESIVEPKEAEVSSED